MVVDGMRIEREVQRAYGDYTSYPTKNARQCAQDCADDYRCRAFDFSRHDQTCWLKDRVPAARHNRDVISGVKMSRKGDRKSNRHDSRWNRNHPDEIAGMNISRNVKRNGGDYRTFYVNNVKECARACAGDNRCQSFNYGKQRRDCWLKNFVPDGIPDKTVISGVKTFKRGRR